MQRFSIAFRRLLGWMLVLSLWSYASQVSSAQITVRMASFSDNTHAFFHELLIEAFRLQGHELQIISAVDVPQTRINLMLESGKLDVHWFLPGEARDSRLHRVPVGLTNGLIGNRILFIPQGQQWVYDRVKNLEDFRALNKVAGFGIGWFDASVWHHNLLPVTELKGDWRVLYKQVAKGNRGVDYFSRGVNEIVTEAPIYPDLEVERGLVLIYDSDFVFYLSPQSALQAPMTKALTQARDSGLIERLIRKHYADVFDRYRLNDRVRITLDTPKGKDAANN
ncbi:hypothetical protein [Shewanella litorisediminis]|uniref:Solute-binding protein family 3/N-terminal domain-containing protein n=1 Tax=Shewanella litorisediminis TaxID=1173586 RepID=A0ABX7G0H3_9GAMM|nr:hypothetical protein [Shewanella litorisediminis]MCL2918166.1 hypothetical protein [Shewanella litorisediminis]QRH00778.1 hypothetical protein JQC75_12935 [Shewanella litorisediminis]